MDVYKNNYKVKHKHKRTQSESQRTQSESQLHKLHKLLKAVKMAGVIGAFLLCIFLIIITTHLMAWVMSFFNSVPDEDYVNPYRLVPRKEHENYKRYERQEYNDSMRRPRKRT